MSSLEHGRVLRAHRRYDEAEAAFRQALADDPIDPDLHFELAQTLLQAPGKEKSHTALQSINRAIGLEPNTMWNLALKAHILSDLGQHKDAAKAADEALAIETHPFAWMARAQALAGLQRWAAAEAACDQALALDPDNDLAQNLRATLTRLQGRATESLQASESRLARDAEDPWAMANAGFAALQSGDRQKAESLFLESLRLDPDQEYARDGLLECYKARSPFYRIYLKWTFFMQRFTDGQQFSIIVGLLVAFLLAKKLLQDFPILLLLLVGAYLSFAIWTFIAPSLGHAIILLDRKARRSLRRHETLDGLIVGLPLIIGLAFCIGELSERGNIIPGCLLIGTAIPLSQVFRNASLPGRLLFGGIGLFSLAVAIYTGFFNNSPTLAPLWRAVVIGIVATTWLASVPFLNRPHRGNRELE